jgi:hypothetical protein
MSLAKQIAQASAEVGGALATDKVNTEQRYGYISSDKILTVCGQALAKHGVAVFPAVIAEVVEVVEYKQGRTRYDAAVTFHMHVSGSEGEPMVLPWVGRGSDYSVPDKALYKAITSGHKYFLMKLLNVGAGNEDGEHEVPNIDMATIPEDTAGHLATPQRSNGKPAPKAAAPAAQNGNTDHAGLVKQANALGAAAWSDWDAKKVALFEANGVDSTDNLSDETLTKLVAKASQVLRDEMAAALDGYDPAGQVDLVRQASANKDGKFAVDHVNMLKDGWNVYFAHKKMNELLAA